VSQDVQVGEVRWKVIEVADLGAELKSDNEFIDPKTTTGKFILVRFELENLSKDQLNFAGVNLTDDQGREFTPKDDVFGFIPNEELCVLEQLNANVQKTCRAVFEVPADASRLVLVAGDLKMFGNDEQQIQLGL
jgi:hypothetical protein